MNDDLTTRFRSAYWAIVHNVDALRLRQWEERGLTLPQLRMLHLLRRNPRTTTNNLAQQTGLTTATVSGLIDKLARNGLVERGRDDADRRVIPLSLTDDGETIVGEIRRGNQAYLSALASSLGDDLEPTLLALERLVAAIDALPATVETGALSV